MQQRPKFSRVTNIQYIMQQQATRLLGYGRDLYAWEQKADDKWDDAIELAIHVNGATVGNGQPELLHSFIQI